MLGRDAEALPWFDRALALRPNFILALTNKASSLGQMHRFDEAAAVYCHVETIDPGNAEAAWDLALLQMLNGNFAAGWAGREARWRARPVPYPILAQPMWLGDEAIAGKTILMCADEGLGDAIQFARYLPMLAERGARVILVVDAAACALLQNVPGVVQCLPKPAAVLPAFDLHCAMSSLPLVFGTRLDTIPAATPYLPPPAPARVQAFEERLGPHDRLRVGLVWAGNPNHSNDHNRSIALRSFAHILDVDATFVSLQKSPCADDRAILRDRAEIIDLTADLADFSATAALVSCLDLVISVDTAVAHLAGALGRPTWILLPYTPDYRWLLDRDDSPWYPSARLFRQNETRDYADVLARVRAALLTEISSFRTAHR